MEQNGRANQAGPARGGGARLLIPRARKLRRSQTDAERRLWHVLRRNGVEGAAFRRQQAMGRYIADFFCPSARLVIELDGGQHGDEKQASRDAARTRWLESNGYRVLRFWNNDVLNNLDGVVEVIRLAVLECSPLPDPPPQGGRGTELHDPAPQGERETEMDHRRIEPRTP